MRTQRTKLAATAAALLLSLVVSCGGDDGDASSADANTAPDACIGGTGCNGACELGNELGVGRYCTEGGGECAGLAALFCTVDFNPADQQFCTRPCDPTGDIVEQCGADASCENENGSGPSGCFPNFCAGP